MVTDMKEPILYQYTDNVIRAPVIDMKTGEQVDPAVFPRVEYSIGEFGGAKLLSLDLSSGISVKNNEFVIFIDDSLIDSSIIGRKRHQLVCWNLAGDKLPPIFSGDILINQVFL